MCVYLLTKFHVSSIILSFRRGNFTPPPTSKRTSKKPTQIMVNLNEKKKVLLKKLGFGRGVTRKFLEGEFDL